MDLRDLTIGERKAYDQGYMEGFDLARQWQPVATAPKDGTHVLIYASPRDGLEGFQTVAAYHDDAGWCVCELRYATHWMPLPAPPSEDR